MQTLALIDYGSGNLRSAARALERVIAEQALDMTVAVTGDAAVVKAADRIVLPGVGAYGACMSGLTALHGMRDALEASVLARKVPFLGICVGMQLMFARGHEHGVHQGLGWLQGEVGPLTPADPALKVPHMGWNRVSVTKAGARHPLLCGVEPGELYFVHSYAAHDCADTELFALTDHGGPIPAIVGRDNFIGMQFHPEKSQAAGLRLIARFLSWSGTGSAQ